MISWEEKSALLSVLEDTRNLLARPGNNFIWSYWQDSAAALKEIDGYITSIKNDQPFDIPKLSARFSATGSIQEVSFSGWVKEYLEIAARFDKAIKPFKVVRPVRKPAGPGKRFGV